MKEALNNVIPVDTRDAQDILESFTDSMSYERWAEQFTEEQLEEMSDSIYDLDVLECNRAIESRLYELRARRDLTRLKNIRWSDIETMIHPNGKSIILLSRKDQKKVGELITFNGAEYHLNIKPNNLD